MQQHLHPKEIWGYAKRVCSKKLKNVSLANAVTVFNHYKPEGFGVTLVGEAELRTTAAGAEVFYMKVDCEHTQYEVCLTLDEIRSFCNGADARTFAPSTPATVLVPKVEAAKA